MGGGVEINPSKCLIFVLIFSCSVFIFFNCMGYAAAADTSHVYVSKSGNDAWNGLSATYNSTTGSGPKKTIKNAVIKAESSTVIHIAPGTYKEHDIEISKSLILSGESRNYTIIDGTQSSRIFKIAAGIEVTITNLTLTHGHNSVYDGSGGGAVLNKGTLILDNCKITNNKATYAAGALFNWGTLKIVNSNIQGNHVTKGHGGAILNEGTLSILDSVLQNNQCYNGGAIYNDGTLNIIESVIQNNKATLWGGGAICNYGEAKVIYSSLYNNTASYGGAIYNYYKTTVNYCKIMGNMASLGSAIRCDSGTVDAKNNWWGSKNIPSGLVSGNVTIPPLLDAPLGHVPIIISSNPVDGVVNMVTNTKITVTFNEAIKWGNRFLELKSSTGITIPINISINDYVLTITPTKELASNTRYKLIFHTGSVTDYSGNSLILSTINFSTGPPPVITSEQVISHQIKLTFNKPIEAGKTSIQLFNSKGFPVTFTSHISGNVLTLTPKFSYHYIYYINPNGTPSYNLKAMKNAGITDVFILVSKSSSSSYYYRKYLPKIKSQSKAAGITLHAWIFPNFTSKDVAWITSMGINTHLDLEFGYFPSTEFVMKYVASIRTASAGKIFTVAVNPNAPDVDTGAVYGDNYSLLSHYVDAIVPMLYKGNYELSYTTMKYAAAYMQKIVPNKLWIALQSYQSDNYAVPLSKDSVLTEINYIKAYTNGIASFRHGLSNFPSTIPYTISKSNRYTLKLQTGSIVDLAGNLLKQTSIVLNIT